MPKKISPGQVLKSINPCHRWLSRQRGEDRDLHCCLTKPKEPTREKGLATGPRTHPKDFKTDNASLYYDYIDKQANVAPKSGNFRTSRTGLLPNHPPFQVRFQTPSAMLWDPSECADFSIGIKSKEIINKLLGKDTSAN